MKTNITRTAKLQAALDFWQTTPTGRPTTAGTFDAADIAFEAECAEHVLAKAGIPPRLRRGTTVLTHARTGTRQWNYLTTVVALRRGVDGWFVTDIMRYRVGNIRRVRISPPEGFDAYEHGRRVLRAAGMVA